MVSLVAATEGLTGDVPVDQPDGIYFPETYFFSEIFARQSCRV